MDQKSAKVSYNDIVRLINRDFPNQKYSDIIEILKDYKGNNDAGTYRVWASILKVSNCNLSKIKNSVDIAKHDYRDIISISEYPEYSEKVGFDSGELDQKFVEKIILNDLNQYQEWFTKK